MGSFITSYSSPNIIIMIKLRRMKVESNVAPATCLHAGFLFGLFFDPEDGGDMFLRNIS
jgi:hypothetical protein